MTTGVFFSIIILCFFVSLFCLFRLGREDVVLIRKNVSMDQLFNLAFLCGCVGVLIGWLGNSLTEGIAGGMIFLMFLTRRKKFPTGRITDLFSVVVLSAMPLFFILFSFFQQQNEMLLYILCAISSFFLFLFFIIILRPKALRVDMKDGSLTFLFLINVSLLTIFISVFRRVNNNFSFSLEDGLLVVIFVSACFFLVRQEKKSLLRYIKR